jgi:glycosyltransferase involved in cell wall biosynthesis
LLAPLKYLLQACDTFRCLRRDGAQVILVASPPIFGALTVWAYCRLFGARYIIDMHTGVFDDPRWTWLLPLSRILARNALTNIVTNAFLRQEVERWGAKAVIVADVPVEFPHVRPFNLGPGFHVAVINTYSQDEPLDEILYAAKRVPNVCFHVTGNPKHSRRPRLQTLPPNVTLTGWLSDTEYTGLLLGADAVMCLTTHDHTMQRGAYEAMALEKPLITSNWGLLRDTFYSGTIHVSNTCADIESAILRIIGEQQRLINGMRRLRRERNDLFATTLETLRKTMVQEQR